MAINNGDKRSFSRLGDREVNWIYDQLNLRNRVEDHLASLPVKRRLIDNYANEGGSELDEIKDLKALSADVLIPDIDLVWIDANNFRLLHWIEYFYQSWCSQDKSMPALSQRTTNSRYEDFIFLLDYWSAPIQQKINFISRAKQEWSRISLNDGRLIWLDKKDLDQMSWAWEYLREYFGKVSPYNSPIMMFNPVDSNEFHSNILSIFDTWKPHHQELNDFQRLMKQTWSQRKYRAKLQKQDKKQSTYILETQTKTKLEKLAKANNLNRHQMLEYLINQAYQLKRSEKQ